MTFNNQMIVKIREIALFTRATPGSSLVHQILSSGKIFQYDLICHKNCSENAKNKYMDMYYLDSWKKPYLKEKIVKKINMDALLTQGKQCTKIPNSLSALSCSQQIKNQLTPAFF